AVDYLPTRISPKSDEYDPGPVGNHSDSQGQGNERKLISPSSQSEIGDWNRHSNDRNQIADSTAACSHSEYDVRENDVVLVQLSGNGGHLQNQDGDSCR